MRIKQVSIKGLFEIFDHIVPLNLEDRITIIHGPNGYGKTALLKMLKSTFNADYNTLLQIPFKDFKIELTDNSFLFVERKVKESPSNNLKENHYKLDISFYKKDKLVEHFEVNERIAEQSLLRSQIPIDIISREISREIPSLERIGTMRWRNIPSGEVLSLEDVINKFYDILPPAMTRSIGKKPPNWLTDLKKQLNCIFIQTQRLFSYSEISRSRYEEDSPPVKNTVLEYSRELTSLIKTKLAEYASLAQNLDSTFPTRFVEHNNPKLSLDEIKNKLEELKQKREKLMKVGLLDKDEKLEFLPEKIPDDKQSVLSIYVADVEKKLGSFDEIAAKIELLLKIINEKFLYKKLSINKENGFSFTTSSGSPLAPDKLSSGEQHELVMLYEMLFKVKPGSLILIDEPEISLHIHWQSQFLADLHEMANLSNFDVIIATHSPELINNRWDLTVELKGPDK